MAANKKYWSGKITKKSHALVLEDRIFTKSPRVIAKSLKKSAERSHNRKTTSFRSAMSMLNFYINRAGKNLSASEKVKLKNAKKELREVFRKSVQ